MALPAAHRRVVTELLRRPRVQWHAGGQRTATTAAASSAQAGQDASEALPATSFTQDSPPSPSDPTLDSFDPIALSKKRKHQLPPSRYQYRPPKYYRGPLHPHQPPPPSDPSSREFVPGPFTAPRLEQTYESTIASDVMVMTYQHHPPGYAPPPTPPRLRAWVGDSPYFKNRPLRGPRGGDTLNLIRRRVTFRNVPRVEGVVVHSFVREAMEDEAALHVANMALQAITGVRVTTHAARHNEVKWGLRAGKYVAATAELRGEGMYHFLSLLVDVVMPRIRDWRGVKGSSGDSNGNISFGLTRDMIALFPEIEVNYDAYPPRLLPGCHITIKTTATADKDARLLLRSMGIPFYGKIVD